MHQQQIAVALRCGTEADCHCFGQLHSAPIGWRTLVRHGVLAAAAAFVVLAGSHDPGISATAWVAGLSAGWGAALGLGVPLVLVLAFFAWFSLQLLSQNGRIFALPRCMRDALGTPANAFVANQKRR